MTYQLDIAAIQDSFNFHKKIRHNPKERTEFLPYTSKFSEVKLDKFHEVVGEFSRLVSGKKLPGRIDVEELLERVLGQVEFEYGVQQRGQLKQMLKTLYVSEDQLHTFHPNVLLYVFTADSENRRLAEFLFDVLWDKRGARQEVMSHSPGDVMTKLLFESLPVLEELTGGEANKYDNLVPSISRLFMKDFTWLAGHPDLFVKHAEKLLAYYYFFYVSQFVLQCDSAIQNRNQDDLSPVFFNVEWESISQTRTSYEEGWKRLERIVEKLFSHVNCLEFLNHTLEPSETALSYGQIFERISSMTEGQQSEVEFQIDTLLTEYQQAVNDVSWDGFRAIRKKKPHELPVLNKICTLFEMIDYQFALAKTRKTQYERYQRWFTHFCQKKFLKPRGRLGKTLNLNADYLLFLTRLVIKDEPKIRLKSLLDEFKLRGMVFDRDTQAAIVEYFEVINILEKKSDSGDALYVKSFL